MSIERNREMPTSILQGGSVNGKVDLWITNWKGRLRSWELPFKFQIYHVQFIREISKKYYSNDAVEKQMKTTKNTEIRLWITFWDKMRAISTFLTEEWSSALERPCVWLSFPSLGGFWDSNLASWRPFVFRLRFFRVFQFPCFMRFSFAFSTASFE